MRVVIIKYCAEYIGPVLSLHNHWRTATIDTFFHIPDNNTTIITTLNYQREQNEKHFHFITNKEFQLILAWSRMISLTAMLNKRTVMI